MEFRTEIERMKSDIKQLFNAQTKAEVEQAAFRERLDKIELEQVAYREHIHAFEQAIAAARERINEIEQASETIYQHQPTRSSM
jgi:predicted  nucleic acid-binding Zn-ribbon protein